MDTDHRSKALATSPASSLSKLGISSVKQAYSDRMILSEAIERVGKMLDRCPHGRPKNEGAYIGGLAHVICQYPRMVAVKCVDPLNGVLRECEYLPTIAKLVAYCERESEFLRNAVERDERLDQLAKEQQQRARDAERAAAERKARPTYDELKAKHGDNWGIGHPHDEADRLARKAATARLEEANTRILQREYAAAGEDPVDAGHGILVSRELRSRIAIAEDTMREARQRRARDLAREADALAEKAAAE